MRLISKIYLFSAIAIVPVLSAPLYALAQANGSFVVGRYEGTVDVATTLTTRPSSLCAPVLAAAGGLRKRRIQIDILKIDTNKLTVTVTVPGSKRLTQSRRKISLEQVDTRNQAFSSQRTAIASRNFKVARNNILLIPSVGQSQEGGLDRAALALSLGVNDDTTKGRGFCVVSFSGTIAKVD